ncbi:hypothetical protein IQ07DRAFT_369707 [Pyrenochaeta sp. DS3sAY3a]|nr:hypothetical protein IQ07DRAFT_369707 [Pyrenochaeta sp. DS3sAY3a]
MLASESRRSFVSPGRVGRYHISEVTWAPLCFLACDINRRFSFTDTSEVYWVRLWSLRFSQSNPFFFRVWFVALGVFRVSTLCRRRCYVETSFHSQAFGSWPLRSFPHQPQFHPYAPIRTWSWENSRRKYLVAIFWSLPLIVNDDGQVAPII